MPDTPVMAADFFEDLDVLFETPEWLPDGSLRTLWQAMVARVTRDMQGLEVSTGTVVLGSVLVKWTVKHQMTSGFLYSGDTGRKGAEDQGYEHPGQEKDALQALIGMAKDFDALIAKARQAVRPSKDSGVPVESIKDILSKFLLKIADVEQRTEYQRMLAEEFDRAGI